MVNVMIKLDYDAIASYAGGIAGPCRDQPARHRQAADRQVHGRDEVHGHIKDRGVRLRQGAQGQGAERSKIGQSFRTVYGGISARDPGQGRQDRPQDRGRRRGPGRQAQPAADRLEPRTSSRPIRCTRALAGPPTPARASSTATSTPASGRSIRRSPTSATSGAPPAEGGRDAAGLRLRRQPADAGARRLRLQRQAHRRQAVPGHATCPTNRAPRGLRHTARDSNGHGTHTASTSAGNIVESREPSSASSAARSTASPPAHGCPSTRSAASRAASPPTPRPPSGRPSSMASTSSTSRSRAEPIRSPTRSSSPSSTPTPRACSSPPRPATTGRAPPPPTTSRRG